MTIAVIVVFGGLSLALLLFVCVMLTDFFIGFMEVSSVGQLAGRITEAAYEAGREMGRRVSRKRSI